MKNFILIPILLLIAAISGLQAQTEWSKNGLTLKYVAFDYYSEVTEGTSPVDLKNLTAGFEIGYHRNLSKYINLSVPLRMGRAEFPLEEGGFTEPRFFGSFDAQLQFQLLEQNWWINPYLLAGSGATLDTEGELILQFPLGGGLDLKLGDGYYLQLQTEKRIDPRGESSNWAHSFGLLILLDDQ